MCAGSASQPPAVDCSWPVEQAAEADQRSVPASALPKTLPQACAVFLGHRTPRVVLACGAALALYRLSEAALGWEDVLVAGGAVCLWLVQEWAIHARLLHSAWPWFGRDLHEDHHNAPYFHVCIDGVELVAPVMALAALAFGAAFHGAPALGRTATLAYWASGLAYLWTHFFVHLPIAPRSRYAQAVRRHHMLHHCRSEEHWLAFCVPAVDAVFGTLPASAAAVPITPLAARQKARMRDKAGLAS